MDDRQPLVVIGDTLLDQDVDGEVNRLAPDAPVPVVDVLGDRSRPGGAGLAAALAARSGRPTVLITALGTEPAADPLRAALEQRVRLIELPLRGTLPVKSRVRTRNRPLLRIDRGDGAPGPPGHGVRAAVREVLGEAAAVLVADYGRGLADALRDELAEAARRTPVVWDPHPRGGPPVAGVRLATPNATEACALDTPGGRPAERDGLRTHGARGARLAERWRAATVAVTLGERGALLTRAGGHSPMYVPTTRTSGGDPCGAGDCFAATAAAALAAGGLPEEAVQLAVSEAAAFVSSGGAGNPALWEDAPGGGRGPARRPADPFALADAVRARDGTVVATGGCFDLLHAGHVGLLENARRTGDCLIVCVNSDASVRRLKGPGRPLNPLDDRVRVLSGLSSVDAVAVFAEDTPEPLLRRLRPDIWVKGGDYRADELPEAAALGEWGGQALVLPYLDGRSTTEIARRVALTRSAHPPLAADEAHP
ncbi:D-glycero-beta-D-manno-heptose 1-phosphate adenylyltransferase [Streptomyces sp. JJ36]|uniref:D-glycero-beta-D-manno-heptose 1-phosphate adenylyltransferase n=1 Tax=Streptomyces sp. JJ36 TaxID=2736645 RepID=UPI001F0211A6|nr:D-glycero-beta-D-manno-heptose 1-phosphate adenylyltransferase [Streptomyces sp. JJ36]MCF6522661.1 D-glycero-beta-D-manno-heptose 1-phosphate adenylyltransferase [Streptomyces sp. JJ36]